MVRLSRLEARKESVVAALGRWAVCGACEGTSPLMRAQRFSVAVGAVGAFGGETGLVAAGRMVEGQGSWRGAYHCGEVVKGIRCTIPFSSWVQ